MKKLFGSPVSELLRALDREACELAVLSVPDDALLADAEGQAVALARSKELSLPAVDLDRVEVRAEGDAVRVFVEYRGDERLVAFHDDLAPALRADGEMAAGVLSFVIPAPRGIDAGGVRALLGTCLHSLLETVPALNLRTASWNKGLAGRVLLRLSQRKAELEGRRGLREAVLGCGFPWRSEA